MPPIVKLLGYAGLLPFVGLALATLIYAGNNLFVDALKLYSFGIFAFMCGAWWPSQDIQHAKFWRTVLSNLFFLVAFFTYLFFAELWLPVGAGLFMLLWSIEHFTALVPNSTAAYRKFRFVLSLIASLSMLSPSLFSLLSNSQS